MSMACSLLHAVDPHWIPDETAYSGNMSVIGVVQIDGIEQSSAMFEIGAFCGDEVRGSQFPQYISQLNRYIFFLTIHGDDPCEITFKLWNHNTGTLSDATTTQTVQYLSQSTVGSVSTPYALNFTTSSVTKYTFSGSGSWTNPSNWTGKDGQPLTELPDFSDEDVVIDGMAFIPNGTFATVKSLTINSEKVLEINNGASLTVTETIENDDDANSLILNDGGQIFQNNENVKATFKKNITNPTVWGNTRSGWNLISSPIVNTTIASFISQDENYDLYIWDGSAEELEWINYKSHSDDEDYEDYFDTYLNCENEYGYGYLASYKTTNTASFTGDLRILDEDGFEFDVYGQKNGEWENLNLLGNPLPFDISSANFERSKVAAGFATLDPSTNSIVYHSNEGTIKVGQGFFVQATNKNPSLSYSTDSKSTRETSKFIDVTVSGKEGHDNVILDFSGSDNEGFSKLTSFNESIATIFTVEDNRMYGINNYDADVKEIPLCFDAKEIGTYTISMNPTGDFNYIHLIDRMTGEDIDMLLESEYKFNALASDNVNRFIVRLSNGDEINGNDNFAYQSGNQLFINEIGTIQIIDMTGRVVINETLSGNSVDISGLGNAAYIVRLVSENGVKTQKIVVL